MRSADLHLHTTHSDGIRSSREVVDLASAHGLSIIAISDHDNLGAYFEAHEYAHSRGIKLIPAVELSTDIDGQDVHLLAYCFDPNAAELQSQLDDFRSRRLRRGARMVDRLIALGLPITHERVDEIRGDASLGRPHIARALLESKVVKSIEEAFDTLLSPGKPGYVETPRMKAFEAIAIVHRAGGVVSIAHPSVYKNYRQIVTSLVTQGVDGIEAFHPDVPSFDSDHFVALARERDLVVTGGSDDHGFEDKMAMGKVRLTEPHLSRFLERAGA